MTLVTIMQTDAGGTLEYSQDALDVLFARLAVNDFALTGGGDDYRPDSVGDFCRESGGILRLHGRSGAHAARNAWSAPAPLRSPELLGSVPEINDQPALRFRDSGGENNILLPQAPANMALGTQESTLIFFARVETTLPNNYIFGPLDVAFPNNDLLVTISNTGAIQYLRIMSSSLAVRWKEAAITDLDAGWHLFVIGYNVTDGFRVSIDGVEKSRSGSLTVDTDGYATGNYQIGARGTTEAGGDFDLAAHQIIRNNDLFRPENSTRLAEIYSAFASHFNY